MIRKTFSSVELFTANSAFVNRFSDRRRIRRLGRLFQASEFLPVQPTVFTQEQLALGVRRTPWVPEGRFFLCWMKRNCFKLATELARLGDGVETGRKQNILILMIMQ